MQNHYPPVVIKSDKEDRHSYYALLSQADVGESWPFVEHIAELMAHSLNLYLKAAEGSDIEEDEDIDKEIALLRIQLKGGTVKKNKSEANLSEVFFNDILPLSLTLDDKIGSFKEYFSYNQNKFKFSYYRNKVKSSRTEVIVEKNIELYKKIFLDTTKEIYSIDINFAFKGYKNPENIFAIAIGLRFYFELFTYKIFLGKELLITKYYGEKLSKEDCSSLIKFTIKDFQQQINLKQNSSK